MSVKGVDNVTTNDGLGTFNEEVIEYYKGLIDMSVSLIAISIADKQSVQIMREAVDLYDLVLFDIKENIIPDAAQIVSNPLVDVVELVECLGPDAVYELLAYAVDTLLGSNSNISSDKLYVFADCMGWVREPENLPPSYLASAIIISYTASINKALNNTLSKAGN